MEAGADAVYLGLRTLNARRRAKNFSPDEFVKAVELVHARGAKAYLTLNIDLAQREVGQAARMLELARRCRTDAVLVRDPALLALRGEYPEIDFHFSTQTCMSNSADVAAAGKLGASRVVLAREMSLREIAAASAVPGVQTEVFVQGALCFSVSGRCLLSSWAGGRSGNRGACTSPCRVPWMEKVSGTICRNGPEGAPHKLCLTPFPSSTPFSMKDLSAINRLPELRQAGVAALKIEGRLKNAAWVNRAVSLYKRALAEKKGTGPLSEKGPVPFFSVAGEEGDKLLEETAELGAYTGRTLTSAYLDGQRDDLTAEAEGRQSSPLPLGEGQGEGGDVYDIDEPLNLSDDHPHPNPLRAPTGTMRSMVGWSGEGIYDLRLMIEPKGIACSCVCGHRTDQWTIPKTVIRRPNKAIAIGTLFDQLAKKKGTGPLEKGPAPFFSLGRRETNDAEFLLTPRAVNSLIDRISNTIRLSKKSPDEMVRIDLPPSVSELLAPGIASEANRLCLGNKPDRVRLDARKAAAFLRHARPEGVIVEGLSSNTLHQIRAICENVPLVVALPQVFFEDDIPAIKKLLRQCADEGVAVEVNSWGGWRLAKAVKATMEAGPGLPVLNSLAARLLGEVGMKCVTLSPEADRRQLEDVTAHCPVPCSLVVFGRPPLLTTRVEVPERYLDQVLTDRRGVEIIPRREHGLSVFRPAEPFDLRGCINERIRVKHLVVDLIGSYDPLADWQNAPLPDDETFRFNYDRTLA